MKLKELLCAVSLTAPRKAFLLLQRIEKSKRKRGKKEENPPEQCSTTAKHTQKDRGSKNESA